MSFLPELSKTNYVTTDEIIPNDWERAKERLEERINSDAQAINEREIAQYVETEIVTGQLFFDPNDAQRLRNAFRKTINFGNLPNAGTTSVAHGISGISTSTVFTRIYGVATDGNTGGSPAQMYLPLPYVELAAGNHIQLDVDTTNVNIVTSIDYSAYTAIVVLEYIKEQ